METIKMSVGKQSIVRQWAARMLETDDYLIDRILSDNDRIAAETLLERHYKSVYKVVYMKVKDVELAMDLTQDTFLVILKSLRQFDSTKASFKTWISKIAENKVIDYKRSNVYRESFVTQVMGEDEVAIDKTEDVAIDNLTMQQVKKALGKKDPISEKIFMMKVREGYTFAEISERLGMPVSTAKSKYYSLVEVLRKEMEGYE